MEQADARADSVIAAVPFDNWWNGLISIMRAVNQSASTPHQTCRRLGHDFLCLLARVLDVHPPSHSVQRRSGDNGFR